MKSIKSVLSKIWAYRDYLLLLVVGILVYLVIHKPSPTLPLSQSNPLILKQADSLRDINGKLYAKVSQQALSQAATQRYADSLANALKLRKNSIKEVDKFVSRDSLVYVDTSTKPVFAPGDTTNYSPIAYSTEFKDAWVDVKAIAGKDTGSITFTDRDTLTRVEVLQKHLFGPTEHIIYIGTTNPHNDITEGASFIVKEKVPAVIILPTFQYSPFNTGSKFNVGISIGLPKFAIKF